MVLHVSWEIDTLGKNIEDTLTFHKIKMRKIGKVITYTYTHICV